MTGHARAFLVAGLTALSAAGCARSGVETTVRITHVRAAVLEVPPSVKRLAVAAFWCDTGGSAALGRGLADDLVVLLAGRPERYDLLAPADLAPLMCEGVLPGSLGPDSARRLGKLAGADAVLYGSITVAVSKTSSARPETGDAIRSKDGNAAGQTVRCRVSVRFAMDDVATGRTIAAVLLTKAGREIDGFPAAGDRMVRRLLRECLAEFVAMVSPSSVDFRVVLDAGKVKIISRGNAFARDGKYGEALGCYQRALADNPGDAAAAFNAGVMCEKQSQLSEALAMYDKALALVPSEKYDRARRRVSGRNGQ